MSASVSTGRTGFVGSATGFPVPARSAASNGPRAASASTVLPATGSTFTTVVPLNVTSPAVKPVTFFASQSCKTAVTFASS